MELGPRGIAAPDSRPGINSGRIMSILLQKDSNRMLVGSASGGIWKRSLANGAVFTPQSDFAGSLSIGVFAADPSNPDVLYAGTGDMGTERDLYEGDGLLKSTDGGVTWAKIEDVDQVLFGKKISGIWVDPKNPQRLLLSGQYFGGLLETLDGGHHWTSKTGGFIVGLVASPADPKRILISYADPMGSSEFYLLLTTDGGVTFNEVPIPWRDSGVIGGRTDLAFAPSDPSIVWASAAPPANGSDKGLSGIYRSEDGGLTFKIAFPGNVQGANWYSNPIAVSPTNPDLIYVGGTDLYRGVYGGELTQVTSGTGEAGKPYIHKDQHAIVIDPANPDTIYVANDGGLYVSTNGGVTWKDQNAGLRITQFNSGAVGPKEGLSSLVGGTQGSGMVRPGSGLQWTETVSGDGFQCAVDPQNEKFVYGSTGGAVYYMSADNGQSFTPLPSLPFFSGEKKPTFSPLTIDPNDGTKLYVGAERVYRGISNRINSVTWTPLGTGALFPGALIRGIAVAPSNSKILYAYGEAWLARSNDGGVTWAKWRTPGPGYSSSLVVHPSNPDVLFYTRFRTSVGNVYRSTDGGVSWADVGDGIPNVPTYHLVLREDGNRLEAYAASEVGVYFADVSAEVPIWSRVGSGLPNVSVSALLLANSKTTLIAATYGRGMWSLNLPDAAPAPPTDLGLKVLSSSGIRLTWIDHSGSEQGFQLQRATNAAFTTGLATISLPEQPGSGAKVTYDNTGLLPNTTYHYRVSAYFGTARSPYAGPVSGTTLPTIPAVPTRLTATAKSQTRIDLAWTDTATNETGYKIERKQGTGEYAQIATTPANTASYSNTTGLTANSTYTYRVRSYNTGGDSAYSNEASATTLVNPPGAPTKLSATVKSQTQIDLAWTNGATTETGFRIERKSGAGEYAEIGVTAANVATFRSAGLTANTAYSYRVCAYNAGGNSPYSNVVTATTLPNPPSAPLELQATPKSQTRIDLTWKDTATETGYKVERKQSGTSYEQIGTASANATAFSSTGLTPNTTYSYRVRAYNTGGDSAPSNEAAATTFPTLPSAPVRLTATAQSAVRIDLSWVDTATNEAGFKIERKQGTGAYRVLDTTAANVVAFSDTRGLAPNTTYTYRLRAFNAGGSSAYSNEASATTWPSPPAAPSQLVATAVSQTQIALKWRDNSLNEEGFRVERKTGNGGYTEVRRLQPNSTSWSDSSLAADTRYRYRVFAFNRSGDSAASNEAEAVTLPNPPAAPSNLTATVLSDVAVRLEWRDNSANELGFRLERKAAGGAFGLVTSPASNSSTYTDTGLTANTTYTYRVRAYNAGGESANSNEATAKTLGKLGGQLVVTPSKINFGKVKVRKSKLVAVTLRNASTTERLQVTVTAPAAPFGLQAPVGTVTLMPGGSQSVGVSFRPTKKKKYSGSLNIASSDPQKRTVSVKLSGSGK